MKFKVAILFLLLVTACRTRESYRQDLLSDDKTKIMAACYELGEARDTTSVRYLLRRVLDPRISHDLRFKGMSVSYCRLGALRKISGQEPAHKLDQFGVDTAAAMFYLNWAIQRGYLKSETDVDINYR